jgi:hypothetical protein
MSKDVITGVSSFLLQNIFVIPVRIDSLAEGRSDR